MKSYSFLLTLVLSGVSAAAQQNDFLNIPKYLEQKSKKLKSATTPLLSFKNIQQNFSLINSEKMSIQKNVYVLSNGDQMYSLSIDHMPCVVPRFIPFMPNGFPSKPRVPYGLGHALPGIIPNVVEPQKIIPAL